ncbi:hypothetical protein LOY37_14265 [Pseudomonas sp. B21-012]|uniref:hypothetical protein n=1 Tax=Pseudomonas sp. B21-012 TaxID=2895472 RepID=UPI00215FE2AE|nr:hypothetical protein [Pseudomonas sp. B21-012]UVM53543.1 hypothetical protein LOY37_14265 [Pseudomonas sp. B21-012]
MTRFALCLLLLATLAGCDTRPETPPQALDVLHDDARGVTCWQSSRNYVSLSCLPDWMLQGQLQAGNERQLSPHEQDTPTPAKAPVRWNEERYEL